MASLTPRPSQTLGARGEGGVARGEGEGVRGEGEGVRQSRSRAHMGCIKTTKNMWLALHPGLPKLWEQEGREKG